MNDVLKNKTVLITRSAENSKRAIEKLKNCGAKVIPFPTLKIQTLENPYKFYDVLNSFGEINFLVFTSVNAVNSFVELLNKKNIGLSFDDCKVIAVGNKTAAACKNNNIPIHIVPEKFSAEGMIKHFENFNLNKLKFFIPGSEIAKSEFKDFLESAGATVYQIPIYSVSIPESGLNKDFLNSVKVKKPDIFIFTSPSTFKNYLKLLEIKNAGNYFNGKTVAAIGPTTAKAIKEANVTVNIIPGTFTIDDTVNGIINYFTNRK